MNAITVVNINKNNFFKICKKSLDAYCNKFNINLEIITDIKYNIKGKDKYNYLTFEKNQIYSLFEKYNRILRLDADVLITPNCPNLFDIVPKNEIGVVYEDIGSRKENRIELIKDIQKEIGDLGWRNGYFNSGLILSSRQHKEIFKLSKDDIDFIINWKTNGPKEQTFLNYRVKKLNFKIYELSFKFNHMQMFSEPWNKCANKYKSFIIHYAGFKAKDFKNIKSDYENLYKKYRIINNYFMQLKSLIKNHIFKIHKKLSILKKNCIN